VYLGARGFLDAEGGAPVAGWQALDEFLRTDPQEVGCARAMEALDIYVDVVSTGRVTDPAKAIDVPVLDRLPAVLAT
jgi:hypothetical protein